MRGRNPVASVARTGMNASRWNAARGRQGRDSCAAPPALFRT